MTVHTADSFSAPRRPGDTLAVITVGLSLNSISAFDDAAMIKAIIGVAEQTSRDPAVRSGNQI